MQKREGEESQRKENEVLRDFMGIVDWNALDWQQVWGGGVEDEREF